MLIAQQKKKENIAEYVIYMFQIEDMMRACNCDFELVKQNIILKYNIDQEELKESLNYWYDNIVQLMINENIKEKGHLQFLLNIIDDLNDLHLALLRSPLHPDYKEAYREAAPVIGHSIQKSGKEGKNEIEVCFETLYMILLLKLQKKEISNDTIYGMNKISKMLALLNEKYFLREKDELDF